jgi:hypothetical protein
VFLPWSLYGWFLVGGIPISKSLDVTFGGVLTKYFRDGFQASIKNT